MKIAYIINSVESGGAALPVPAITKVMRDAGHHVEVFALTRRNGLAIEPLENAGLTLHIRPGTRKDHLPALRWLHKQMRAYKPDVIWTSLSRATLLADGWTMAAYSRCKLAAFRAPQTPERSPVTPL